MQTDQLEFLKEQIELKIVKMNGSRLHYRKIAFWAYLFVTILSAVSTILLGLDIERLKDVFRITAMVLSGSITVISAYNTFFDNKRMWIAYNNALNDFLTLKFDIEFLEKKTLAVDSPAVEEFRHRFQCIVDKLNEMWTQSRLK